MFSHKHKDESVTYVIFCRHSTREEEVGDGGENQAAGGDEQAHPPGPDPAGVSVSQLLLSSCRKQQSPDTAVNHLSCFNRSIKQLWDAFKDPIIT